MRTARTALISGRIQYDHLCISCGQEEREIYTERGTPIVWKNITLHKKLAAAQSGA